MAKQTNHLYEFGAFRLDPDERLLLRDGEPVELTPKTFDTLVALVENSGHLLRKEDLIRRVWPDATVEDSNLTLAVHTLRKKLSNGEGGNHYIETVPRHGYRFICEVKLNLREGKAAAKALQQAEISPNLQSADAAPQGADDSAGKPVVPQIFVPGRAVANRTGKWALLAAALIFVAAPFAYKVRSYATNRTPTSLAILPFLDLSPSSSEPYLADALSEELTTSLARLKGLRVTARTSAFQFRSAKDVRQIGRALNVNALLEGSIRQSGSHLYITAQLIDARNGYQVWSETFDTTTGDLLYTQQRIAEEIARGLNVPISREQQRQISKIPTSSQDAYELCLQGRYFFSKRDIGSMQRAIQLFSQAIERDPKFAEAHAGLAATYAVIAANGQAAYASVVPAAVSSANRAATLDPGLAGPHATLGLIRSQLEWNFPAAEEEFRRALELDDNNADAHHWRGLNLTSMGRFDEAEAELRKAQLLDPLTLMTTEGMFENYFYQRRYDDAIGEARKLLEMDPNMALGYRLLAIAYLKKGMYREAFTQWEEERKRDPDPNAVLSTQVMISAYSGDPATAGRMLSQLRAHQAQAYFEPYYLASAYASVGDKDNAFVWLEKELQEHDPSLAHLNIDPLMDGLRDDPRCLDLLHRAGVSKVSVSSLVARGVAPAPK
jgi:TolB-like protein/DNA-binding winged helix-turn-helix (wHTH) protein/Tfp pilus assembly protein PilF